MWIRLITHRLYANWGHAVAVADTVAWLDAHGIPYRDLCFLGQKPQVEADAYVDDAPHNIDALRAAGNTVIVFDQPYNPEVPGPRARSWPEVERLVLDLVARVGPPGAGSAPGERARVAAATGPTTASQPPEFAVRRAREGSRATSRTRRSPPMDCVREWSRIGASAWATG